jgi:E3 ubiquitin-protein ligase HUWE1
VIVWFWSAVSKLTQSSLENLLHYCTGSSKVPLLGFKYLESNRSTVTKFTIEKARYNKLNPYPKGHTCFNRLELPEYPSKEELEDKLNVIVNQELTHFGLN